MSWKQVPTVILSDSLYMLVAMQSCSRINALVRTIMGWWLQWSASMLCLCVRSHRGHVGNETAECVEEAGRLRKRRTVHCWVPAGLMGVQEARRKEGERVKRMRLQRSPRSSQRGAAPQTCGARSIVRACQLSGLAQV